MILRDVKISMRGAKRRPDSVNAPIKINDHAQGGSWKIPFTFLTN